MAMDAASLLKLLIYESADSINAETFVARSMEPRF
jgi:hypothetical protein